MTEYLIMGALLCLARFKREKAIFKIGSLMREGHRLARHDEERCEALTASENRCHLVVSDKCAMCGLRVCYKGIRQCPSCGIRLCIHCAAVAYKKNQGKCPNSTCSFAANDWNNYFIWECPRRLDSIQILHSTK
jgi:hypothetical protein